MKLDLSRKAMMMRLLYIVAGFIMFKVYRNSYPRGTNDRNENIGARRLHTVLEKIIEDISFSAPDLKDKDVLIDSGYVNNNLKI